MPSLRWSQARVTRDIDITLLTGFGREDPYIEALLANYAPRNTNAAQFAYSLIGLVATRARLRFTGTINLPCSFRMATPNRTFLLCQEEDISTLP